MARNAAERTHEITKKHSAALAHDVAEAEAGRGQQQQRPERLDEVRGQA
jgi:hypothetical protein